MSTIQKIIYTIYHIVFDAVVATMPNGQEQHFDWVGCTSQDPTERAKAFARSNLRVLNAMAFLEKLGLPTTFHLEVLAQTEDIFEAEKLETEYLNKYSSNPYSLNVVRDSAYARVMKAAEKDALVDISIAPNKNGGVATFRVNGSHVRIQYSSFAGQPKPLDKRPTLVQVFNELGIEPISKAEYVKLAKRSKANWTTLAVLVTPEGSEVQTLEQTAVSK